MEGFVEPADAAKAGRQGDLHHRETRFVDQLLGQQHPPGLRDRNRRCAKMPPEEPPKVALADPQPLRSLSTLASSKAPISISASARETVFDVPRQAPRSGAVSGRQRKHGRKPASCAAAAER